ncbi:MAG: DUF975 family protein [Oscillospiraceae bacterium]|nr:DUF975 family protein [Oscillospiraceae bacterium]
MWTISEIKEEGKAAFKANYWCCVLAAFLISLFAGAGGASTASNNQNGSMSSAVEGMSSSEMMTVAVFVIGAVAVALLIGAVIRIFLGNPINVGCRTFFKENVYDAPAPLSLIKTGFQNYGHTFVTLFLRDLYLVLWTLLLIIPGIIKAYSYRMVPYILAEHPEMPANEIITRSREMMDGNKWQAFLLDLSFIGWILLGVVTLGLGLVFWTSPYMESTNAALYLRLKEAQGA